MVKIHQNQSYDNTDVGAESFKTFEQCVQQGLVSRHRNSAGVGVAQASLLVRAGHGMHSCCALVWSLYYNDNIMHSTPLGTETVLNYA